MLREPCLCHVHMWEQLGPFPRLSRGLLLNNRWTQEADNVVSELKESGSFTVSLSAYLSVSQVPGGVGVKACLFSLQEPGHHAGGQQWILCAA